MQLPPTRAAGTFAGSLTPITIVVYLAIFCIWKQLVFVNNSFVILRLLFLAGVAIVLLSRGRIYEIPGYFLGRILPDLPLSQIILTLAYFVSGRLAMMAFTQTWAHGLSYFRSDSLDAPINEEMVFRGIFLAILLQYLPRSPKLAVFISALIFITTHHLTTHNGLFDIHYFISLLLLGCLTGWTYLRSKSVPFCMVCHSLWNCVGYFPLLHL